VLAETGRRSGCGTTINEIHYQSDTFSSNCSVDSLAVCVSGTPSRARPRLLDLFCGAGGAGMGYHRAGFDVVGVDVKPQPHYPFHFVQADAVEYLTECAWSFDAIHASPPCQRFTSMAARWRKRDGNPHHDWLTPTRAALASIKKPWVIENVGGARRAMSPSLVLHGGMFGLGVHRPRLFESNVLIPTPYGDRTVDPVGVYGDHAQPNFPRRVWKRSDGSILRAASSVAEAQRVMGIDWMTEWRELCEAIPPAYTEWIGRHLIGALQPSEAAS
jgi:DNA (cytosine-5)-methyltransferase 1